MTDRNSPTPQRIFQIITAFHASAALKGAIDLGLFTAIGREERSAAALAKALGAGERGIRILCDFLVIQGLLEKTGTAYRCSPDAALFLDESSPAYFGSVGRFMMAPDLMDAFSDIAGIVRNGKTLMKGAGVVEPDHPIWVEFARSMVPLIQPSADFVGELVAGSVDRAAPLRVLDVAAGHGVFGIAVAARHPRAEIVALDWPAVLEVAVENSKKAGVADRLSLLPGDVFEVELGDGYDVVLLTNFLHHFDVPTCTRLLGKIHSALNIGGRVVTLEFVPNEDRVTPPEQASFSLVMLATTAAGDAYTFQELQSMFAAAGFAKSELHRLAGPPQAVVVSTKDSGS